MNLGVGWLIVRLRAIDGSRRLAVVNNTMVYVQDILNESRTKTNVDEIFAGH